MDILVNNVFLLTERKIEDAVMQMKAMGYNDNDGWLTHLVKSNGGDINKVLDTLNIR